LQSSPQNITFDTIKVQDVMQNNDDYVFIEWPEIAAELLPTNCIKAHINFISETEREITTS
jgi:tRNA A37 threonylcarbamoyladenosine biosynthesis protein TsaE